MPDGRKRDKAVSKKLRDVGLTTHDHRLLYGWSYGFGRRWLPYLVKRLIVRAWNHLACKRYGHQDLGFGACQSCCQPFPINEALWDELDRHAEEHWGPGSRMKRP